MSPNTLKAIIRSLTPWAIGLVASLIAKFGYHVSLSVVSQIVGIVGIGLTVIAHALEVKWPWFGVFLGWLGAPAYSPIVTKAELQAQLTALEASLAAANDVSPAPGTPVAVTLTPNG